MIKSVLVLTAALAVPACLDSTESARDPSDRDLLERKQRCRPEALDASLPWYGTNRQTITGWLDSAGCASPGYDAQRRPIALFDWDNTLSKNDFGDAITFYVIAHDQVVQPPGQDWKRTSAYMTDAGAAALTAACGTDVPAGARLPTSTNLGCADEMLSMYIDNKTRAGATAFAGHNFRRMEPTYAWTAQLLAGHSHLEVQLMTLAAVLPQLSAAEGTTQVVGTHTLNGWLRVYDQSRDVVRAAQTRGYDAWIITASPQDVIVAVAPLVGIAPSRVIGIHSLTDGAGKLSYRFEGCGPVPDGEQSLISYIEGKRCWINKIGFGDTTATAMDRRHDPRQVFAAGDSDTDIEFLRDSTYKLVLNRNKKELMCFAYHNAGDSWRINPMFIQPKGMQAALYPCSTTACKAADGTSGPCREDDGSVIPDQADTVFGS